MAGGDEEGSVGVAEHFKNTPEAGRGDFPEAAANGEPVAEAGGALVVDLGAGDDGIDVSFRHGAEVHAELGGEPGAAGLDHAEVGDVVDDTAAIGIEKHDFLVGFHGREALLHGGSEAYVRRICNLRLWEGVGIAFISVQWFLER